MKHLFEQERVLIGQGRMANVYLWKGFAYKCFQSDYPEDWITYELHIQNTVSQLGLPTVKYYPSEIPHSLKMDYIKGISLADKMQQEKYLHGIEDLFKLMLSVHENRGLDLPSLNPFLVEEISKLDLDSSYKALALTFISEIPDKDVLCHLDFHFLNVMCAEDKDYIIDWVNAKLGNPIYDFARSYVILYEFAYRLSKKYLKMIKVHGSFDVLELSKAIYVMAVHRLTEYQSEKVKQLVEQYFIINSKND